MNKNILFFTALLAINGLQAGGVIAIDAKEASEAVKENQDALVPVLESLNAEKGTKFRWQNALFLVHQTLGFVTQNELSAAKIEEEFPGISQAMQEVADEFGPFDMIIDENTKLDWFDGKFEVLCGDSKKKNYKTGVLKLENAALALLANRASGKLKEKFNIVQRFPFSGHVSLGRVYDENDQPLTPELQETLNNHKAVISKPITIHVSEFKLKGHDGSEIVFKLKDRAS